MPSCSSTVCGMLHGAELTPWDSAHECLWRGVRRRSEKPLWLHCHTSVPTVPLKGVAAPLAPAEPPQEHRCAAEQHH